jgi:hypothetical protein
MSGVGYRLLPDDRAVVVVLLENQLPIARSLQWAGKCYEVDSLDVFYCDVSHETMKIPATILEICHSSFLGSKVSTLLFEPEAVLPTIDGFQCCPLSRLSIPDSVEIIRSEAFAECKSLHLVEFGMESQLRALAGFKGTAIRKISFPRSLEVVAMNALTRCSELWLIQFAEDCILRSIFVPRCRVVIMPDSDSSPVVVSRSRRFLLCYSNRSLAAKRRRCAYHSYGWCSRERSGVPDDDDIPVSWIVRASWVGLPLMLTKPADMDQSLSLTVRCHDRDLPFVGPPRTYKFCNNSGTTFLNLASVLAMFSQTSLFGCRAGCHARQPHFVFSLECERCGREYYLKLKCPFSGQGLRLSTRRCCGHFFSARIPTVDRRTAARFLTKANIDLPESYGLMHPVRAIARALLHRSASDHPLGAAERALLEPLVLWHCHAWDSLSFVPDRSSLAPMIAAIPGRFYLL